MDGLFYIRWLAVGFFIAFITIVALLTWDGMVIWLAWTALAAEALITGKVVASTLQPRKPKHPSTVKARTTSPRAT